MRQFPLRTLPAALSLALVAGPLRAQVPDISYSHHWAPMANTVAAAYSGPGLFTVGLIPNYASAGDALRRCYGIDTTLGTRHRQSDGQGEAPPPPDVFKTTNFHVLQGWAASNAIPGVDVGLVSVQAATESDLGGDACFSPFLASVGNTGGHHVSGAAVIGLIGGTGGLAFPTVWDIVFQWVGTGTAFDGVGGPSTIGLDPAGAFPTNPLLVNMIYEVQGPLNGAVNNNQYYLASTTELTGEGNSTGGGGAGPGTPAVYGTGGVTNGNLAWASSLFGVDATTSGAIAHSRIIATDVAAGVVAFYVPAFPGAATGHVEMGGYVGLQAPFLWASNNGSVGAGGADPVVSTAPTSVIDLHYQDHLAGAETTSALFGGLGGPSAAFTPGIVFNAPIFLWSSSTAAGMSQAPTSWDDLGGVVPAVPGSIVLGPQMTSRHGLQTVPIVFDATTTIFLSFSGFTFGTPFTESNDLFLDGAVPAGANSSYFEGAFNPIVSGVSNFSGGAATVATPAPGLAGATLGVAAIGIQFNALTGVLSLTEVGSSLEMNLQ